MKFLSLALASLAGLASAAPQCVVPEIVFSTLPHLFTVNLLIGSKTFDVYLLPGRLDGKTYNKPLLSTTPVTPEVKFNLTNGVLYTSGYSANARYLPSGPHPTTVQEILFGVNKTANANERFTAGYDCDANGKQILTLRTQEGFIVGSEDQGAELYIVPNGYAGDTKNDFIPTIVKINEGV